MCTTVQLDLWQNDPVFIYCFQESSSLQQALPSFLKGVTALPQRSHIQDNSDLPYLLGADLPFSILLLHLVSSMGARYCSPAGSSSWNSAANQRLGEWENENKVNFPLGLENRRNTDTIWDLLPRKIKATKMARLHKLIPVHNLFLPFLFFFP